MFRIVFCFFLLVSVSLNAQPQEGSNPIYGSVEFQMGNYKGLDLSAYYIVKQHCALVAGVSLLSRTAVSTPDDFEVWDITVLGVPVGGQYAYDEMATFNLGAGRVINLHDKLRFNCTARIGYSIVKTPVNWEALEGDFVDNGWSRNYNYEYQYQNAISLKINPKMELLLNSYVGLTLSPLLIYNRHTTYYGIGAGLCVGRLKFL